MTLRTVALLLLPLLPIASPAAALEILFETEDLVDEAPGEDLWRYRYTVGSQVFETGQGFSILFQPDSFASLAPPPAPSAEWDAIVIQPDPLLPDFGLYDALALVDAPDTSVSFAVDFVWKGAGSPGAQPFVLYAADFTSLASGTTVLVPEAHTALLLAAGLAGLCARRRGA